MRTNRSAIVGASVLTVIAGVVLFGCSSHNNPTSPYGGSPGGGGGGTGGSTAFNSGTLNAPAAFVHTFPTAGAVGYHCVFHASMGMVGTVNVTAQAADSAVVVAAGTSFTPSTVDIKPGGYVRWNVTSGTHTVTSN
jgi:plastocyanin